ELTDDECATPGHHHASHAPPSSIARRWLHLLWSHRSHRRSTEIKPPPVHAGASRAPPASKEAAKVKQDKLQHIENTKKLIKMCDTVEEALSEAYTELLNIKKYAENTCVYLPEFVNVIIFLGCACILLVHTSWLPEDLITVTGDMCNVLEIRTIVGSRAIVSLYAGITMHFPASHRLGTALDPMQKVAHAYSTLRACIWRLGTALDQMHNAADT
ncbi:hypothetical protein EI94DRAFT_1703539, partial [Lactarius quietus]